MSIKLIDLPFLEDKEDIYLYNIRLVTRSELPYNRKGYLDIVKEFQEFKGLVIDGIIGPKTLNSLLNELTKYENIKYMSDWEAYATYGDIGNYSLDPNDNRKLKCSLEYKRNEIVELELPDYLIVYTGAKKKTIQIHKKIKDKLNNVFEEIYENNLWNKIISFGGTFVPRFKGWRDMSNMDEKIWYKYMSRHTFGIAIDLNIRHNGYGQFPSLYGEEGCLLDIVPIFARHGFYWGGWFSPKYYDGMHFELGIKND